MIPGTAMEDPYTFMASLVVVCETPGTVFWWSLKPKTSVYCSQVSVTLTMGHFQYLATESMDVYGLETQRQLLVGDKKVIS